MNQQLMLLYPQFFLGYPSCYPGNDLADRSSKDIDKLHFFLHEPNQFSSVSDDFVRN
jgi:hypothetical protein